MGVKTGRGGLRRICVAIPTAVMLCLFVVALFNTPAFPQDSPPPAAEVTPDKWPKTADTGGTKYTIYQPRLEKWDGYHVTARAAVSALPQGAKDPLFGVIDVSAVTETDRLSRVVRFSNVRITKTTFPSAPDKEGVFQDNLRTILSTYTFTPSLDRMLAALAVPGVEKKGRAVPVKNEPPRFIFARSATVLIPIDGEPAWRAVRGTPFSRVLNSRALILSDTTGKVYLHLFDGFLEASSLSGPWQVWANPAADAARIAADLAKGNIVDLMEGPPDEENTGRKASLKNGVPGIVIGTAPTELVVTEGPPDFAPIDGTSLLYARNTRANLFRNMKDGYTYILDAGRWFKAPGLDGPWQHVAGKDLPPDFARIPDDSPKENVKASVPGTPQAREAVIANEIPHTARVFRGEARFAPEVSGEPVIKPVSGTTLNYVVNSPTPIIMVSPTEWYAVKSGVWFAAPDFQGPWIVATSIPAAVYTIPPSSPIYYVTYVKVYDATPKYVVTGYTPGYMGAIVSTDDVVVYGTGYAYEPYIGDSTWYGEPVTYGYDANPTWTPWTGWTMGFDMGCAFGAAIAGSDSYWGYAPAPYWGAMPYSPFAGYVRGPYGGAAAWGPGGWAAVTGDVYRHWGPTTAESRSSVGYNAWTGNGWSDKVGTSYNSVTGRISAGQKASVANVYTGGYAYGERGATYNPSTGVAARAGSVTYGNVDTGKEHTVTYEKATGPGGKSVTEVKSGVTSYYAGPDGNVYKSTGEGWQKYGGGGGWDNVRAPAIRETQTLPSKPVTIEPLEGERQARIQGDQRSAASSWGSERWGGGFSERPDMARPEARYEAPRNLSLPSNDRDRAGLSEENRAWGGGGWSRGGGGGRSRR